MSYHTFGGGKKVGYGQYTSDRERTRAFLNNPSDCGRYHQHQDVSQQQRNDNLICLMPPILVSQARFPTCYMIYTSTKRFTSSVLVLRLCNVTLRKAFLVILQDVPCPLINTQILSNVLFLTYPSSSQILNIAEMKAKQNKKSNKLKCQSFSSWTSNITPSHVYLCCLDSLFLQLVVNLFTI